MQRLQAFKYELKPDGAQQRLMRRYAGSYRFVYNKALALQQANHAAGETFIGYVAMAKHLTAWRNGTETPWLKDAPVHPLQHALKDLDKAYKNFFANGLRASRPSGKFSNNWKKAKAKVQKIHTKIANARRDFLHKATTTISQNHAVVFVEELQVWNMSQSAAGTAENPGTNVAAKSGLNKAILDQGWGEFRRQLDYKTVWNGGMLFTVPPQYTSQTCPCCGHVSADNRQTQACFACVACGYENHADVVGAVNVLERGHRLLACGDGALRLSMKQKPAEVSQLSG
ncbi:MAG: transposase [Candidatus Thiothrix putei]|uniref:Transposase n=1 Tax=Candidatus Thiothrix putei TaxID=3080811 RepID=A0AA95KJG0_9GAMM|nr:MAG: transposase [Candidatus Thiothrix putei]